jgi:hypothetical protein
MTGLALDSHFARFDPDQAVEFLQCLHGLCKGYVGVSWLLQGRRGQNRHGSDRLAGVITGLKDHQDVMQAYLDRGYDAYVAVCTTRDRLAEFKRTQQRDVIEVPGVWADFDVKDTEDGFRSRAELDAYLATLPEPTIAVDTGSGGAHWYWLFDAPMRGRPGEVADDDGHVNELLHDWHAQLAALAGGRAIDNVQETARIMRLAGTTRFKDGGQRPVRLTRVNGPRYYARDLRAWARPAGEAARAAAAVRRQEFAQAEALRLDRLPVSWQEYAFVQAYFDQHQDWEPLLKRAGWKFSSEDADRVRYWTRPGKRVEDGHSASTDSPRTELNADRSGLMSIYTTDPCVDGLFMDDRRSPGFTTKYRFARHALFDDDDTALLEAIMRGGGVLP